jgi:hypothetical protein
MKEIKWDDILKSKNIITRYSKVNMVLTCLEQFSIILNIVYSSYMTFSNLILYP